MEVNDDEKKDNEKQDGIFSGGCDGIFWAF